MISPASASAAPLLIERSTTTGGELSLTARQGGFALGGLHGQSTPDGLSVTDLWGLARADASLLRRLLDSGRAGGEAELLQPGAPLSETVLVDAGLRNNGRRLLIERGLDDLPDRPDFQVSSMSEIGVTAFAEAFEAALSGCRHPELASRTPGEWLLRFWRRGGAFVGAQRWVMLHDALGPVGLVLPGLNRSTGEGWMSFFGVLPERRGQRLGAPLHAWGLHALRESGATWYRDTTSMESPAVRRVAARNGCVEVGVATVWRLAGRDAV